MPGVVRFVIDVEKLQELRSELQTPDEAVRHLAEWLVADIDEHWSTESPGPVGGPPGVLTGALSDSIHAKRLRPGTWAVEDQVEYGLLLEVGSTGMGARPWMVPATERLRQEMPDIFKEIIEDIL